MTRKMGNKPIDLERFFHMSDAMNHGQRTTETTFADFMTCLKERCGQHMDKAVKARSGLGTIVGDTCFKRWKAMSREPYPFTEAQKKQSRALGLTQAQFTKIMDDSIATPDDLIAYLKSVDEMPKPLVPDLAPSKVPAVKKQSTPKQAAPVPRLHPSSSFKEPSVINDSKISRAPRIQHAQEGPSSDHDAQVSTGGQMWMNHPFSSETSGAKSPEVTPRVPSNDATMNEQKMLTAPHDCSLAVTSRAEMAWAAALDGARLAAQAAVQDTNERENTSLTLDQDQSVAVDGRQVSSSPALVVSAAADDEDEEDNSNTSDDEPYIGPTSITHYDHWAIPDPDWRGCYIEAPKMPGCGPWELPLPDTMDPDVFIKPDLEQINTLLGGISLVAKRQPPTVTVMPTVRQHTAILADMSEDGVVSDVVHATRWKAYRLLLCWAAHVRQHAKPPAYPPMSLVGFLQAQIRQNLIDEGNDARDFVVKKIRKRLRKGLVLFPGRNYQLPKRPTVSRYEPDVGRNANGKRGMNPSPSPDDQAGIDEDVMLATKRHRREREETHDSGTAEALSEEHEPAGIDAVLRASVDAAVRQSTFASEFYYPSMHNDGDESSEMGRAGEGVDADGGCEGMDGEICHFKREAAYDIGYVEGEI